MVASTHFIRELGILRLGISVAVCLLVYGCTDRQYQMVNRTDLSWRELQKRVDVSFGAPRWEDSKLLIPVKEISKTTGDSLHVNRYRTNVLQDQIHVTVRLGLPDEKAEERDRLLVTIDDPQYEQYTIVYESPDGSINQIQQIKVPPQ